jgi:hypothetical protein
MVGGTLCLFWCFTALAMSIAKFTPGISLYPEIDFAAKLMRKESTSSRHTQRVSLSTVLSRLSGANSYQIRKALTGLRFYVRVMSPVVEGNNRPVSLISGDNRSMSSTSEQENGLSAF